MLVQGLGAIGSWISSSSVNHTCPVFNPGRCRESFGLLTIAEDHPRTRLMTEMFDIIADL